MNYCFPYKYSITCFYTFTKLVSRLYILLETKRKNRDNWILGIGVSGKPRMGMQLGLQERWGEVGAGNPQGTHVAYVLYLLSLLPCVSFKILPTASHAPRLTWWHMVRVSLFSGLTAGRDISSYSQFQIPGAGTMAWFGLDAYPGQAWGGVTEWLQRNNSLHMCMRTRVWWWAQYTLQRAALRSSRYMIRAIALLDYCHTPFLKIRRRRDDKSWLSHNFIRKKSPVVPKVFWCIISFSL